MLIRGVRQHAERRGAPHGDAEVLGRARAVLHHRCPVGRVHPRAGHHPRPLRRRAAIRLRDALDDLVRGRDPLAGEQGTEGFEQPRTVGLEQGGHRSGSSQWA